MQVKPRFYIIIGAVVILIIIIGAAVASSGVKPKPKTPGLATVTVNGEVGVAQVTISNQNTGKSIIKTAAELPYSFNCSEGDTIQLKIVTVSGYGWNAWELNVSPWFAQDNPYTMRVTGDVAFFARCLLGGTP